MPRPLALRPEPRDAAGVRATLVEASTTAVRWLVLLAVALVAAPAPARAAASTPCPGVRFFVTPALVPGSELATDAVVLDADGTLTIASGCAAVPARVGRRGARSSIRARWTACGTLRYVRLHAKIDRTSCGVLTGTFAARAAKRRRFEATPSTCGDGRVDTAAGEQCETDADCLAGQSCTTCICGSQTSTATDGRKKKTTTTATSSTTTSSTTTTSPTTTTSSTTTSPTTTTATTTTSSSSTTTTVPGQLFEAPNPWNTDVSTLPKSGTSDGIIQAIAAMLFSADEVASGAIDHAIRFILPNSRMRSGVYVRPATHAGGPTGGAALPPYGVRFRLRADYPLASLPSEGARVIARAMQRYGMILSDGGNIALTAQSDRFTTHKWTEVGVDSHSLTAIQVTDMEVVGMGATIPLTYDCVRTP